MGENKVVTQEEYDPHGLSCIDCDKPLPPGSLYAARPLGMVGDTPMEEIICAGCDEKENSA